MQKRLPFFAWHQYVHLLIYLTVVFHQPLCTSLRILCIETIIQAGKLLSCCVFSDINLSWLQTADGLVTLYKWLLAVHTQPRHRSSRKTGLWCVENSVSPQSCPQGLWGVLDYDTARTNIKPIVQKGHQHAEMNMASVHQRDWTLFMTPTRCHVQGFQAAERYVDLQKFDWTRWG